MAPSPITSQPGPLRLFLYRFTQYTSLSKRQNAVGNQNVDPRIIPSTYLGIGTDPSPSTVVGITLGTVLGVIIVIMIVWWALYQQGQGYIAEEVIVEDRHHHPRRRSRRYSDTEIREVRRPASRAASPRRRTEIVEERIVEERIPLPVPRAAVSREDIIIEPRRRRGSMRGSTRDEEEVIVYEESESSGPPIRRGSGRRSSGNYPKRPVSRRYS